jgi:hypothetical protein
MVLYIGHFGISIDLDTSHICVFCMTEKENQNWKWPVGHTIDRRIMWIGNKWCVWM